jgi:hypothetical protein
MTVPAIRPGDKVWRIGPRSKQPLPCIVVRSRGGNILVKAGRFSRDEQAVNTSDVFPDRDACRAEIQRRASETKEPTP